LWVIKQATDFPWNPQISAFQTGSWGPLRWLQSGARWCV